MADVSWVVNICLAVFTLSLDSILVAGSARFLLGLSSATVELGIGRDLFILTLNRFRYQINLLPLFLCNVCLESGLRRSQLAILHLIRVFGPLLTAWVLILASVHFTPQALREPFNPIASTVLPEVGIFAVIKKVEHGSLANQVGLNEGMTIWKVNGKKLETSRDLIFEYRRSVDVIELEVRPKQSTVVTTFSIPVRNKAKQLQPLGITYNTWLEESSSSRLTISMIYDIIRAAILQGSRTWLGDIVLLGKDVKLQTLGPGIVNPTIFILAATYLLLLSFLCLLNSIGTKYLPWFILILTLVRPVPESWKVASMFFLFLIVFSKMKQQELTMPMSLIWVSLYHLKAIFDGILIGMLLQIADLKHLELLWTL